MILPDPGLTIWLYTPAANMRCQIDGLAALTARKLQETPHNGALYVFTNRHQPLLDGWQDDASAEPPVTPTEVKGHKRRSRKQRSGQEVNDSGLRFDDSVPQRATKNHRVARP